MAEKQAVPAVRGGAGGGGSGGGPAPFLVKTHQMVEDAATDQVISWTEDGSGFVVWKPVEFARDLLPAHFKHNNFSSFVRQLNTYGFRKVAPDRWEFANDHFRRGEQRLLQEIRRRKASNAAQHVLPSRLRGHNSTAPAAAGAPSSDEDRSSSSTSSLSPHEHKQLAEENEKLRKDNQALCSELAVARQHCEELLAFLSRYVDLEKLEPAGLMKTFGSADPAAPKVAAGAADSVEDQKDGKGEGEESLKLFGVWLTKRSRCEEGCDGAGRAKKRAAMGRFRLLRWAEAISSSPLQGAGSV